MIKNKKYKGFSLIEVMIIFTALSMILLAFLPIMLKRSQKVMAHDCVGGLRRVIKEYSKPGNYTFDVPSKIASPINVTLLGPGGSGQSAIPERQSSNTCNFNYTSANGHEIYTNIVLNMVGRGQNANCNNNQAGASGYYYPNIRISGRRGRMDTTVNAFDCDVSKSDGTIECKILRVNDGNYTCLKLNAINQDCPTGFQNNGDKSDGTPNAGSPQKLLGGIPGARVSDNLNKVYGLGQSCKLEQVPGSAEYRYVPDGTATEGACNTTYNIATIGRGGGSGAFLKIARAFNPGERCNLHVGVGQRPGAATADDTTFSCGDHGTLYKAGGATGVDGGSYEPGADSSILFRREGQDNAGLMLGSDFKAYSGAESRVQYNGDDELGTIYSHGGAGGCEGDGALTSDRCLDPDGKSGMFGSGGGGASCNEERCGTGGKGGDGLAIVEYMEYCK